MARRRAPRNARARERSPGRSRSSPRGTTHRGGGRAARAPGTQRLCKAPRTAPASRDGTRAAARHLRLREAQSIAWTERQRLRRSGRLRLVELLRSRVQLAVRGARAKCCPETP